MTKEHHKKGQNSPLKPLELLLWKRMQGARLNDMDVMAKALRIKIKILKDPLISGGYDG